MLGEKESGKSRSFSPQGKEEGSNKVMITRDNVKGYNTCVMPGVTA